MSMERTNRYGNPIIRRAEGKTLSETRQAVFAEQQQKQVFRPHEETTTTEERVINRPSSTRVEQVEATARAEAEADAELMATQISRPFRRTRRDENTRARHEEWAADSIGTPVFRSSAAMKERRAALKREVRAQIASDGERLLARNRQKASAHLLRQQLNYDVDAVGGDPSLAVDAHNPLNGPVMNTYVRAYGNFSHLLK